MIDERLLRRLDWLLTALTVRLLLSLVLAGFALLVLDTAVGLLALTTVVLVCRRHGPLVPPVERDVARCRGIRPVGSGGTISPPR